MARRKKAARRGRPPGSSKAAKSGGRRHILRSLEQKPNFARAEELALLERGFVPEETKHGVPFKGKNRVIIA